MIVNIFEKKLTKNLLVMAAFFLYQSSECSATCNLVPQGAYKDSCDNCTLSAQGSQCILACSCVSAVSGFVRPSRVSTQIDIATCKPPVTPGFPNVRLVYNYHGTLKCQP
jgi:hypothetical protein